MHGEASLASERRTREEFARLLQVQGEHALEIARQLLDITAVLDSNQRLQRVITDPGRTPEDRVALAHKLIEGRVDPLTEQIVCSLAGKRWSKAIHIVNSTEDIAVDAVFYAADARGVTSQVSAELSRVHSALLNLPEVLAGLSDTRASWDARARLLDAVIRTDELNPLTKFLIDHVAHQPRRRRFLSALNWLTERISAHEGDRVVTVTTAVPLTDEQRARINAAYSKKLGTSVYINSIVDPKVLGGMRIQHGPQVTDTTVVAQLQTLQRTLG
ncbi:F0F1 ATP synthase subunit delta [Alloscardovia theropitheci]|uniref:ATP synthase subunit delta n=1 Tax=Alloscardovia theropitheci TaxID=2496842 RepID=A0A4R0QPF3_9BIFI|nr:F0F1 ATP synthase subunit delta [Alloscardovia theropitheci]TCD54093.1 F0F1 ATP synthase subunit delta [Alloscardovia theropitheci]